MSVTVQFETDNAAFEDPGEAARINSDPGQPTKTLAERYLRMAAYTFRHVWRD